MSYAILGFGKIVQALARKKHQRDGRPRTTIPKRPIRSDTTAIREEERFR